MEQKNYDALNQPIRNLYYRIDILDKNLYKVDEIVADVLTGNVSINSESDVRRTCSLSMVITDDKYDVLYGGRIWLDKFVKIYQGVEDIRTGDIVWYNLGVYIIDAPNWTYDATTHTLSISGLDMMAKLTGLRNGNLVGVPTVIPQGSNVREAIIATLALGGFTKYVVSECDNDGFIQPVPYDITIDQGGTVYDILKALVEILPIYHMYFDVDGVFHYELRPIAYNAPVVLTDDVWKDVVLSETSDIDFQAVKNVIELYGFSHTVSHYASAVTVAGNTYNTTMAGVTAYDENLLYGFTAPSVVASPYFKINNLQAYPVIDYDGTPAIIPEANQYYIVKWDATLSKFYFVGYQQPKAFVQDDDPNSPFYINGDTGIIRIVLYGGEYDNIQTNYLAMQRAKYELDRRTRLQNTVNLTCVPLYYLDVDNIVDYTSRKAEFPQSYVIKNISMDLGYNGTQTVSMVTRFYQYYSVYIGNNINLSIENDGFVVNRDMFATTYGKSLQYGTPTETMTVDINSVSGNLVARGKNLFNKSKQFIIGASSVADIPTGVQVTGSTSVTQLVDITDLWNNDILTLSANITKSAQALNSIISMGVCDVNGANKVQLATSTSSAPLFNIYLSLANATQPFIYLQIDVTNATSADYIQVNNLQIEYFGSGYNDSLKPPTSTAYEPYIQSSLVLPELNGISLSIPTDNIVNTAFVYNFATRELSWNYSEPYYGSMMYGVEQNGELDLYRDYTNEYEFVDLSIDNGNLIAITP